MQEKFVLRKIAAVTTSAAMLGMTLTGALAADLSNYPAPFDGADTMIIVGEAGSADNAAAADIAMGLAGEAPMATTSTGRRGSTPFVPTQAGLSDFEKWEDLPMSVQFNDTTDGFGSSVDADDIEGFQDTTIDIDIDEVDDDYDVRDEIRYGGDFITAANVLTAETGLSFDGDEDWQDRVFIPMRQGSWGYFYVFEDNLRAGNEINQSDNDDEIEIEFLGKRLEIEGTTGNIGNKLVVNVGQRFYMEAGDSVVVDGKEVSLIQTGTTTATIEVDGVREVVTQNTEEIVNGLEVRVEDVSSDEGVEYDSATLFVGEDARETYDDGEEFIGEDEDDPAWVWKLANLTGNTPVMGILWNLDLDSPDEDDNPLYEHPIYEGESVCLPFDYTCLVFDSLQIDDYQDYEIKTNEVTDLYFSVPNSTSNNKDVSGERVLVFRAKGSSDDGFLACNAVFPVTPTNAATSGATNCTVAGLTTETDTVSFAVYSNATMANMFGLANAFQTTVGAGLNAATSGNAGVVPWRGELNNYICCGAGPQNTTQVGGTLLVFREEQDGSDDIWFNSVRNGTIVTDVFQIEYRDTVLSVGVDATFGGVGCGTASTGTLAGRAQSQTNWTMFIDPETRGQNISIYFETDEDSVDCAVNTHNDLRYLGHSDSDSSTARDAIYGVMPRAGDQVIAMPTTASRDISGKEEDLRTANGIIVLDPEAHQSSDDFEIRVPSDISDFKANIVVRSSGAAGAAGSIVNAGSVVSSGPEQVTDAEAADSWRGKNVVVVGGPAVNQVAAELLGLEFPAYGAASGVNAGEAVLQLVDNDGAQALIAFGYEAQDTRRAGVVLKNFEEFALSGSSAVVRGASLEVSGITVESA